MLKPLLFIVILTISNPAFTQTDSIFVKSQIAPVTGAMSIDYRKQVVSVRAISAVRSLSFNEINEIRAETHKYYVSRTLSGQSQLLVLLIRGKYSLLYQEKAKIFYIEEEGTVKVISKRHIELALPLIFGTETIESFNQKTNQSAEYSLSYLRKLTSHANEVANSKQRVFDESFRQFKPKIYIGPYIGVSSNRLRLTDVAKNTRTGEYFRTSPYTAISAPVGININVEVSSRIGWELDVYYNKITLNNLAIDSGGLYQIFMVNEYSIPSKYGQKLELDKFSYKSVTSDLLVRYNFIKKGSSRLTPYANFGPSLSIMTDEAMTLGSHITGSDEIEKYRTFRWNKANKKNIMLALNFGVGLNYQISKRIGVNVFTRYQRGRFPRVLHQGSTIPNENKYDYSYDQYTNTISLNGTIMIRVL